jgi:hypothetical protein
MPAFAVFLGLLMLAAFAIGDNLGDGLMPFGVMVAVALGIVMFRRNETRQRAQRPGARRALGADRRPRHRADRHDADRCCARAPDSSSRMMVCHPGVER